jgi:phage regulator Rha-like protein
MSDITPFEYDSQLVVDSRLIAQELGIEHESFMRTIDTNKTLAEQAFGFFRFQIGKIDGRGRPERYVLLTEDQATFLMTLSRNTYPPSLDNLPSVSLQLNRVLTPIATFN